MRQLNECTISGNNTSFFRTEKKKTFVLSSEKDFYCEVVDVDKCVFKDVKIKRCDWLFLVPKKQNLHIQKEKAYFVELKGEDTSDACEQLFNAIDRLKNQIANFEIEASVISPKGRQPEITNSDYHKRTRKLIKKDIEFCKVHRGNRFTHVEII